MTTAKKKPAAESRGSSDAGCFGYLVVPVSKTGRAGVLSAVVAFLFGFRIRRSAEVEVQDKGDREAGEDQDDAKHVTSFCNVKNVSVR